MHALRSGLGTCLQKDTSLRRHHQFFLPCCLSRNQTGHYNLVWTMEIWTILLSKIPTLCLLKHKSLVVLKRQKYCQNLISWMCSTRLGLQRGWSGWQHLELRNVSSSSVLFLLVWKMLLLVSSGWLIESWGISWACVPLRTWTISWCSSGWGVP